MIKQSLLIVLRLLLTLPFALFGQNETKEAPKTESNTFIYRPKKGEFHIGIQDIRVNFYEGEKTYYQPITKNWIYDI